MPSTLCGVLAIGIFSWFRGKDLDKDPEYNEKIIWQSEKKPWIGVSEDGVNEKWFGIEKIKKKPEVAVLLGILKASSMDTYNHCSRVAIVTGQIFPRPSLSWPNPLISQPFAVLHPIVEK